MTEIFAASLTPFTSGGADVDHGWIPAHLRWLESHGLSGVVPCGTTGEGPSIGFAERMAVIDTVLAHRGGLKVIPGTGCAALPDTIALTRYALQHGADSALVLPPFFIKGISDAGLLAYYRAVCDALPTGGTIMLYHIPQVSSVPISAEVIAGLLASHPDRIMGLKDSAGDPDHTAMLIIRFPQLRIYTGSAAGFARALADGAAGGIFAVANAFPQTMCAIAAGETGAQERAAVISTMLKSYSPIAALKALLPHLAGLPASAVRPPLLDMTANEITTLAASIKALP